MSCSVYPYVHVHVPLDFKYGRGTYVVLEEAASGGVKKGGFLEEIIFDEVLGIDLLVFEGGC